MDLNRKQRLIGVLVLIAVAAIAIPVFFEFTYKKPSTDLSLSIPTEPAMPDVAISDIYDDEIDLSELDDFELSKDITSLKKEEIKKEDPRVLGDDAKEVKTAKANTTVAKKDVNKQDPRVLEDDGKSLKETVKVAKKAVKKEIQQVHANISKPKTTVKKPETWAVQLGSFSKKQNANKLIERLRKKGVTAFAKESKSNNKAITRVMVGPSADKTKAEKMVQQLDKDFHLKAIVVKYKV